MKRKMWLLTSLAVATIALGACGTKKEPTATSKSSEKVSQVEESSSVEASTQSEAVVAESVIKGTLKEAVKVDGEKVSFFLVAVEGVSDPNELAKGIGEEGVVLNAEISQVDGDFVEADYAEGQVVEVTLEGNAIMARSMPPQIPGASIISIKKQ